jgi:hypothetical protein
VNNRSCQALFRFASILMAVFLDDGISKFYKTARRYYTSIIDI